jgi:PadR family transcriptional regulator AphA
MSLRHVALTYMALASPSEPGPSTRTRQTAAALPAPAYVVLGMIGLGARSGYDVKQLVELSIRFFWTISHAQIYPSLELLEDRSLIRGRSDPRGRRRRRVFQITAAGQRELREWLRRPEPIPFELRDLGLVKLFFADALDPAEALELLGSIRRRSQERVETLQAIETAGTEAAQEGNVHPLLTLRMGIAVHQAMVDTCREFEAGLTAG